MGAWADGKWIDLIQSAGIILGIILNIAALREGTRGRRVSTLVTIADHHRQIWSEYLHRPELRRVRSAHADLHANPISLEEEMFVKFVIIHLQSAFRAAKLGEVADLGNIQADAARFLSLPIPAAIWNTAKRVHSNDFVDFIDNAEGKTS